MDSVIVLKGMFFVLFIILSAFFSSAETAFTAINKVKLRNEDNQKKKGAKLLLKILEKPRSIITAMLIGNNITNVAASALATAVFLNLFQKIGINNFATEMALVTLSMTLILLIFGEITPKTFAIKNPVQYAMSIAKITQFILIIFKPLIILFNYISILISKLFRISSEDASKIYSEEDIKAMAEISEEEGAIEKEEKEMIHSIFELSKTIAREIMTPRTDAICVERTATVEDVVNLIIEHGHSRIPVYEDKIDNIVGVVFAKDLLKVENMDEVKISSHIRKVIFIPETKSVEDLLHQMQKNKFHIAIVVDEYGGMSGLVTLEDIIEEIMGEIQDEYDTNEMPELTEINPNRFKADAGISIDDLGEKLDIEFPEDDDFDSLGGFILSICGRLPEKNETITYKNLTLTISDIRKRRILSVEIEKHVTSNISTENKE